MRWREHLTGPKVFRAGLEAFTISDASGCGTPNARLSPRARTSTAHWTSYWLDHYSVLCYNPVDTPLADLLLAEPCYPVAHPSELH